jgi:uncharacterized protein DUF1566
LAAFVLVAMVLSGTIGFLIGSSSFVSAGGGGGKGGGVPAGNGDVNGDGSLDISDAVYIINNQFLGGPAPVAIECPTPAGKGLPATGQTKCYQYLGSVGFVEIPCDDPAVCPGQDPAYQAGCGGEGRFTDNGDDTVTDNCTGLMWQKDTPDVNGDGQVSPEDENGGDAVSWCDALSYCENLSFASHDDWRLPNVRELQSIVDYGRFNPAIEPLFGAFSSDGQGHPEFWYWSSTSYEGNSDFAWKVGFRYGNVGATDFKNYHSFIRAVRNGP